MEFGNIELPLLTASVAGLLIALAVGGMVIFRAELRGNYFAAQSAEMPILHRMRSEVAELQSARDHREAEVQDLRRILSELHREQAEVERTSLDAQHWQSLVEQAKREYDGLSDKISEVDRVKDEYEEEANNLAERRQELDEVLRKRDAVDAEIGDIETRREEAERLKTKVEEGEKKLGEIREVIAEQEDFRDRLIQARFEVDQLERRHAELENKLSMLPQEISELEEQRKTLEVDIEVLEALRVESDQLETVIDSLNAKEAALETRIAELKNEHEALHAEIKGIVVKGDLDDASDTALNDLWHRPACLYDAGGLILKSKRDEASEQEAIDGVGSYLDELGLQFDENVVKKFHTSLKISRISPLTVLAGISGTGKSLLPQCYTEAMGIPFLKVPVQPRWDSPQDLLGFYNYLEKQYKATEFARALAYVDAQSMNQDHLEDLLDDRMLLVLLDEMNLARVEYYFSEFLSRLEGRKAPEVTDPDLIRPSRIEIDVPLGNDKSVTIYPGHNALFVGTMNEDESTQALSDKVLDRGNAIRFKKPEQLSTRSEDITVKPIKEFLTFETWQSWYKSDLPSDKKERLDTNVEKINKLLNEIGRPFGHRVYQAILAYTANHPDVNNASSEDVALADMLEMRVLPKLRGVELGRTGERAISGLAAIVENDLGNEDLARRIKIDSIGEDGMFNWAG
jgi:hypothetical protein